MSHLASFLLGVATTTLVYVVAAERAERRVRAQLRRRLDSLAALERAHWQRMQTEVAQRELWATTRLGALETKQ